MKNENQTAFCKCEDIGRSLLSEFLSTQNTSNIEYTSNIFNVVDVYFMLNDSKAVGEIKCRDIKYKNYSTHLIEKKKLDSIIKEGRRNKVQAGFYFNFFDYDWLYIYDVVDILKYGIGITRYCNKTTAIYTSNIDKRCIDIPTRYATKIYKYNDGWFRVKDEYIALIDTINRTTKELDTLAPTLLKNGIASEFAIDMIDILNNLKKQTKYEYN